MSSGRQERWTHEDFAAGRGPELVRLAYAVSGDPQVAHDAVVRALTRMGRDWSGVLESGSPLLEGRQAVLREVLRSPRASSAFGFSPTAAAWDEEGDLDADSPRSAVLQAYAALDPADRSVLALTVIDGLDAGQVSAATGEHVTSTASRRDRALATLTVARAAAAPTSRRQGSVPVPVEEDLREALHDAVADAHLDADVIPPVTARLATRQRRRKQLAAAGLAVVVLAGGAAAASTLGGGPQRPAALSTGTPSTTGRPVARSGYAAWPARGALATNPVLLAAVARAGIPEWHIDSFTSEVGQTKVIWADRVDGEVLAVAAYPFFDQARTTVTGTAISVFRGSEPALVERDPLGYEPGAEDLLAFATRLGKGGSLVVLGAPGVQGVQWSSRLTYTVEGTKRRTDWTTLDLASGAAVVPLGDRPAWAASVRGPQSLVPVGSLADPTGTGDDPWTPLLRLPAGASTAAVDARLVRLVSDSVASLSGLPAAQVRTRILASPTLRSDVAIGFFGTSEPARLVVLLSTLPSGAVLRSAYVHQTDLPADARALGIALPGALPAVDAARRPFVALVSPTSGADAVALVVAPGARWVTLHSPETGDATTAVQGGLARLPVSSSVVNGTVTTFDAARKRTGTWDWPMPGEEDPLGGD